MIINKIDKIFEIINGYYNNGISCCQGCFYARAASCGGRNERIPLCLEQIKKHTGIDYTNDVNEWYEDKMRIKEAQ